MKRALEAAFDAAAWGTSLTLTFALMRVLNHRIRGAPAGLILHHLAPLPTLPISALITVFVAALSPAFGLACGLYRGRFLRGSLDEVLAVAATVTATALAFGAVAAVSLRGSQPVGTSGEESVTAAAAAFAAMLGARYVVFTAKLRARPALPSATKIIVFGAGGAGAQLIRRLAVHPAAGYRPVAVLDDDRTKRHLRVHGVPVLGTRADMAAVARRTGATMLVIALVAAEEPVIRDLVARAESCGLEARTIPSVAELIDGCDRIDSVRHPRIGSMLGREPIRIDVGAVADRIRGRRVLVTGAGGSIGSELCRQLHRFQPERLYLLDHDESALHAVQLALTGRALLDSGNLVLADVRDPVRMREVFESCQPDVIFHAAALKHLPMLERYPGEALKSNVWGTLTVLREAAAHGIGLFVNISTDKAADPICVLGYTKRIGERLTAHMASQADGTYLSVRFGNVLGSRGSVLTTLSAQVAAGGPVTVTDPAVTRYFMTVDEAVQLVLQAAVIGDSGEVLVLDMGEPVRIADLAGELIGRTGRAIDIVYTGLRQGEKLSEDLLAAGEPDDRPRHPLVCQVPVPPIDPGWLGDLESAADPAVLRGQLAAVQAALVPDRAQSRTLHPSSPIRAVNAQKAAAAAK